MKPNQNLYSLTSDIIKDLRPIPDDFSLDYFFVHEDTTATMNSSLAVFYTSAKVCYIEAGLRALNKRSPFPEKMNRCVTGALADIHFSLTRTSQENGLKENKPSASILVTKNTVIDALRLSVKVSTPDFETIEIKSLKEPLRTGNNLILVTAVGGKLMGKAISLYALS